MLLPFLMCILILYVPLPESSAAAPWPLILAGVAVLALLNVAAGWAGSGLALRLGSDPSGRSALAADRVFSFLKGGVVGFVLADVFALHWPAVVGGLLGGSVWTELGYDIVLVLPALVMIVTVMAWQHRYEYSQGRVSLSLGRYVWLRFRVELGIVLAPWLLLVMASGITMVVFGESRWASAADELATGLVLVLLIVFSPLMLRAIWHTSPLPAGPLRERLEAFCRAQSFRCSDILVWHTHRHMANAGVVGPTPFMRYVMLTDALLHHSTDEEVEAVFAHEIAHVRCRHLPFYILFGLAFVSFYANLVDALSAAGWVSPLQGTLGLSMTTDHAVVMLAFAAFYWAFVFGYISRRMELQADVFALFAVESPPAFVSALGKLRALSRAPGGLSFWRHFSVERRIAFLQGLLGNPPAVEEFRRSARRIKQVFLALAIAATARLLVFRPELFGL
jgi:STE24 endopeptidase